ncbi:DUF6482 family protein [Shewanella woodyi]|uniref:Uncharacterized protein n=1 Tax=Shewanella woodyi (strain ATCC 51908 / MS32) TaxID=392500 RepID=B1KDU0_SHEWM|nr:DUF6482 family protein [Shewanella woodyi]ACA87942.1 hypothetical protein Swoo_3680 [Shewanella woodyi ATCC 51908]
MDIHFQESSQVQETSKIQQFSPKIIGVADSTQYLVGAIDCKNNFVELNEEKRIRCFNSLAQAKDLLRSHQYKTVELEYQSAYDEMCGLPSCDNYKELIQL